MKGLRENLEKAAMKLNDMRDVVVSNYVDMLNNFTPQDGCPAAADAAGVLHDLDRHITNCEMELKRMDLVGAMDTINSTRDMGVSHV